ncbi:unnamed protein product [Clonostachys rosea f. rosea IK726]|jgi:hypothetical protein|uniref:Uncharacterized protein n=1 Tax=Clonostachys rosea f. rosea IK726 TaxID=1349383 RepID=A0ACA9USU1_BIOOC|nr:unnamed protein product [Clonostachys rosea f. rosea IK726]
MVAIKNLSIASAVILSVADQGLAAPINTRAPKKGVKTGLAHHALSVGGQVGAAFAGARRDVEERSPKKGVKTGLAHHALSVAGNVGAAFAGARRDLEDLEERDFDELDERDFDEDVYELVTRSPKKGVKTGLAHHALSVGGQVGAAFAGARRDIDEELVARALEDLDERDVMDIYARYFDDAEDFEY